MYNATTRPETVTSTVFEELKKVKYWHIKKYHGEKGYDKMCEKLRVKAATENKVTYSDLSEYTSAEGNKWYMSTGEKVIKGGFLEFLVGFCYYETVASFGIFIPLLTMGWENMNYKYTCIYISDHFFLRYIDKKKFNGSKKDLAFMIAKCVHESGARTEVNENGLVKCDIHVPGGIGRGFLRQNCPFLEVRTFLRDEELNGKQKKVKRELVKSVNSNRSKRKDLLLPGKVADGMNGFYERHRDRIELMKEPMKHDNRKCERLDDMLSAATIVAGSFMSQEWADAFDVKYWDDVFDKITPVILRHIDEGKLNDLLEKVLMYKECFDTLNKDGRYKWNKRSASIYIGFCLGDYNGVEEWIDKHKAQLGIR